MAAIGAPEGTFDGDDGWAGRRGQRLEELSDDGSGTGIAEVRGDLCKRDEDKGALVKARVRDFKGGFVENEVTINDHVEIEGAGAVRDSCGTVAAEVTLNSQKRGEKFERGE